MSEKQKLVNSLYGNPQAVDPAVLLAIFQLLAELIKCWRDRKTPQEALEDASRPGFLKRGLFWRMVKRHVKKEWQDDVYERLINRGEKFTLEEMERLYSEA